MVIAITGASGFIGRTLVRMAHQRGHEVIAFSRSPERSIEWAAEQRKFTLEEPPDLSGCEAVIHLAGEPVFGLWTRKKRLAIMESRVQGTRRVAEAIAKLPEKPEVLVTASGIGYYGDGGDTELTEQSPRGTGFLADTCVAWEAEAQLAQAARVVAMRIGMVLGHKGGPLQVMASAFRVGLGGSVGDGHQWISWIHLEDLARLYLFAVEDMSVRGPLNACAPWPIRHAEFMKSLARVLRRPALIRTPAFLVKLALGGLSDAILQSQRAVPAAALDHGFGFKFPELEPALKDLLG